MCSPFFSQACASSHSLCSNLSSTWSLSEFPSPLGGPEAAGEAAIVRGPEPHTSVRYLPHPKREEDTADIHIITNMQNAFQFAVRSFHI